MAKKKKAYELYEFFQMVKDDQGKDNGKRLKKKPKFLERSDEKEEKKLDTQTQEDEQKEEMESLKKKLPSIFEWRDYETKEGDEEENQEEQSTDVQKEEAEVEVEEETETKPEEEIETKSEEQTEESIEDIEQEATPVVTKPKREIEREAWEEDDLKSDDDRLFVFVPTKEGEMKDERKTALEKRKDEKVKKPVGKAREKKIEEKTKTDDEGIPKIIEFTLTTGIFIIIFFAVALVFSYVLGYYIGMKRMESQMKDKKKEAVRNKTDSSIDETLMKLKKVNKKKDKKLKEKPSVTKHKTAFYTVRIFTSEHKEDAEAIKEKINKTNEIGHSAFLHKVGEGEWITCVGKFESNNAPNVLELLGQMKQLIVGKEKKRLFKDAIVYKISK